MRTFSMFMRVSSVVRCALYAHCSVVDKFLMSCIPFGYQYSRIPFIFKSSDRNFKKFQIIKEKGLVVSEIYVYLLCTRKTEKMKATVKTEKEVELKTLVVKAGVRYWEDATVNGVEDDQGVLIPCRVGDYWCPIIDIDSGIITNWTQGTKADIHYKVCDDGSYYMQDSEGKTILSKDGYVPEIMCPNGEGFGDYIIMTVDENGKIENWKPTLDGFIDED